MLSNSIKTIIQQKGSVVKPGAEKVHYGEWVGTINLYTKRGEFDMTLSVSNDIYSSKQKALVAMRKAIKEIRNGVGGT